MSEAELLQRVEAGFGPARREVLQQQLARWRQQPDGLDQIQRLLEPYRRRMNDISIFIKELKGSFAQWFNRRHRRYGALWAERFKSVLLEGGEVLAALSALHRVLRKRAGSSAIKQHRFAISSIINPAIMFPLVSFTVILYAI